MILAARSSGGSGVVSTDMHLLPSPRQPGESHGSAAAPCSATLTRGPRFRPRGATMSHLIAAALLSAASLAAEPLWLAREVTPDMMGDGPSFMPKWKRLSASRYHLL